MEKYIPEPIDLTDVGLDGSLNELREALAENAHDIWAGNRLKEGWKYGLKRDDTKKENPDLVPYSELSEKEKEYDRAVAMRTLKLVSKLGYEIVKREETELYQVLINRIRKSKEEFRCRKCHNVIYRHQIFCDNCGEKLDIDWNQL